MKRPSAPPAASSAAVRFRREIERAEAGGVSRDAMTLRLTYGDAGQLRRDRTLAVEDISFSGGVMRYLGVAIAQGGVAESELAYQDEQARTDRAS
ncbi:MAG TPA: hypothetical protein VKT30_17170 [Caulobacteraceae bacterium]|nr:hypothetical protein [Caulobacteraceae bacterium]